MHRSIGRFARRSNSVRFQIRALLIDLLSGKVFLRVLEFFGLFNLMTLSAGPQRINGVVPRELTTICPGRIID